MKSESHDSTGALFYLGVVILVVSFCVAEIHTPQLGHYLNHEEKQIFTQCSAAVVLKL
jgi:hypothetical protein